VASDGAHAAYDAGAPVPLEDVGAVPEPFADWVDPFIGTGGVGFGYAAAYPGPAAPFGMIHPGPDTARDGVDINVTHFSGFYYDDPEIVGFSQMRLQGTGVADLGNILVMPTTGFQPEMAVGEGYRSSYSHDTESASPGYYAVTLERYGIRVELTTGYRAALHRYSYMDGTAPTILIDPTHFAGTSGKVLSASARFESGRVLGHVHYSGSMSGRDGGVRFFYVAELDRPVLETRAWADGAPTTLADFQGISGGIALRLDGGGGSVQL
jgi:putative alpha-1,2-mannosidase